MKNKIINGANPHTPSSKSPRVNEFYCLVFIITVKE